MSKSCRFCAAPLHVTFADLGMSPVSNAYIATEEAGRMEPFYPLHAYVCERCHLVQLGEVGLGAELFSDAYAYFSSYSDSWLRHARAYAEKTVAAEALGPDALVVEIASNDGYLLQYFKQAGVPVLGVEPTANTAAVAWNERGVPSEVAFFGRETAQRLVARGLRADVIAANNVLAHVPDLNDFVSGFAILLKPGGLANFEFPHLLRIIEEKQFDTIYHEHFSYFSLTTARAVLAAHGLRVFDVEELETHGGSLRLHACHADEGRAETARVGAMIDRERRGGLGELATYRRFDAAVVQTKCDLLGFLIQCRREGRSVVGYGAPAKGNTLLNYCGVKPDLLEFTVDRSPHKSGKLLPGSRIPIRTPDAIFARRPDFVLILPWNLKTEVMAQMTGIAEWGGRFVTPIPALKVHP